MFPTHPHAAGQPKRSALLWLDNAESLCSSSLLSLLLRQARARHLRQPCLRSPSPAHTGATDFSPTQVAPWHHGHTCGIFHSKRCLVTRPLPDQRGFSPRAAACISWRCVLNVPWLPLASTLGARLGHRLTYHANILTGSGRSAFVSLATPKFRVAAAARCPTFRSSPLSPSQFPAAYTSRRTRLAAHQHRPNPHHSHKEWASLSPAWMSPREN